MLMKMSQYKSVTVFTVSICLASILLAILVAYACDLAALAKARDEAYEAYKDAEEALAAHRAKNPAHIIAGSFIGGTSNAVYQGSMWVLTGASMSVAPIAASAASGAVAVGC